MCNRAVLEVEQARRPSDYVKLEYNQGGVICGILATRNLRRILLITDPDCLYSRVAFGTSLEAFRSICKMLFVECSGTPFEIGRQHGTAARPQIHACISFYAALFRENCKLTWPQVLLAAQPFAETARQNWPAYYEEMRGIADGSGADLMAVVAVNVRSEINFGMFGDGCTALSWHTGERAWMGQNWDWKSAQSPNLILQKISFPTPAPSEHTSQPLPTILQITEAGIIGKIGFNSSSVGTLLNAIRCPGADASRLPVHFALRMVLESSSTVDAVQKLQKHGVAASAHILVADGSSAVGVELTKSTVALVQPDARGRIVHANHLLLPHEGETDTVWLKDSPVRVQTMTENADALGEEPGWEDVLGLFEDEQHAPCAIARVESKESGTGTLFNIVVDLKKKKGVLRLGTPGDPEEMVALEL